MQTRSQCSTALLTRATYHFGHSRSHQVSALHQIRDWCQNSQQTRTRGGCGTRTDGPARFLEADLRALSMKLSCAARNFAVPCSQKAALMRPAICGWLAHSELGYAAGVDCVCTGFCRALGWCMTLHTKQRRDAHVFDSLVGVVRARGLQVRVNQGGCVNCDEVDRCCAAADGLRVPPEQAHGIVGHTSTFDAQA